MPFYRIDISLKGPHTGTVRQTSVIREYAQKDIERVWQNLENKSRAKWGNSIKEFNCVQISKRSSDYQRYLKEQWGHKKDKDAFGSINPNVNLVAKNKNGSEK